MLLFYLQVAQLDQEVVRVTALQVVFDLLLTFGLEAFKVNASVPELEHDEPSTTGEKQDESGNEDDDDNEKEKDDDKDVEESQAPDTDTAASVLTILTGILESEVNYNYDFVFLLLLSCPFNIQIFPFQKFWICHC